jgi:hypothetical protein
MQAIRSDRQKTSCATGAVHIWVPAFAGTTARIKKAGQCPPFSKTRFDPDARAELKTPPGPEDYFFFLAFDFFAFFAFFAFLAIVSSQEFHGLKRDYEACSAEGQPHNILDGKLNRFAACCLALSRQRHRVIHSCYAF